MEQLPSYKKIWTISLPIILSLLAQNIVGATDTAFLGWVGNTELAAAAIGGVYYYVLFMLGFGFTTGTQILIARRNGEKNYTAIGPLMENCWYLLLIGSVALIIASTYLAPIMFKAMMKSHDVEVAAAEFVRYRVFGLPFAFIGASFRAFHIGTTKSSVLSISSAIMAFVNIILAYIFIFGKFGFPAWGIKGAAIASCIAELTAAAFLILSNSNKHAYQRYHLFHFKKINFKLMREMLSLSIYIMLLYFISISTWLTFFLIVEQTGERNLAISNIVRSLYSLVMLPIWAYTSTVSSLVSNAIGAGRTDYVVRIIKRTCNLGLITSCTISLLVLAFGHYMLLPFSRDVSLITDALPSLRVIAFANIIFGVSSVVFNGITGTGKTHVSMLIEFVTLAVYLGFAFAMVKLHPQNIALAWTSEVIYWAMMGIISVCYLKWGKWRGVRI